MVRVDELPHNALRVCAVFLGLIWGSFLNVVIARTPRGMSVVKPPSHCPHCKKPIRAWDNVPVLSWIILRGKARCCGATIGFQYPLVELLGAAASVAVLELVVFEMPTASAARAAAMYVTDFATILGLIVVAFIDFEYMYIPDEVTLGGTVLGVVTASFRGMSIFGAVGAGIIGFLIAYVPFVFLYRMARGRAGMGLGDAKLLMMTGAFFGLQGVLWTLFAGAVQGTLGAFLLWLLRGKLDMPAGVKEELAELRKAAEAGDQEAKQILEEDPLAEDDEDGRPASRMAFGPFLALAFVEMMLFRPELLDLIHKSFYVM